MIEAKNMEHEISTGRLRVAMIGAEKNGKSVLCSTAPGIKLFLDFDQRREAVAGKKGVYAITLSDPKYPRMPEAAEEALDIMSGLENSLDLSQLKNKNGTLLFPEAKEGTMVESLMFDSMSSFASCMQKYEMYNNEALRRSIKIGPNLEIHVPKNYDAWKAEMEGVAAVVFRAFALPINVYCTFHEAAEESVDSTDEKPKYTGRVSIYPVRYKMLLKYFNEVWRVRLTPIPSRDGVRYLPRVYPLPDFSMDAATTMLLDPVEEPSIEEMIKKHHQRLSMPQGTGNLAVVPSGKYK
jgi:hypothetical protein